MSRIALRDYQEDAHRRIAAAEQRGARAQLGVAATGLGKTVIFATLAQARAERALILAHRDELITQAAGKVLEVWPELGATESTIMALRAADHPAAESAVLNSRGIGIIKAGANDVHAHVVVASVQTLARERRLNQLLHAMSDEQVLIRAADPFGLVVVDEAHHAAADSYGRILDGLRAGTDDGPLLLGVTATPDRGDGLGLDRRFSEIVFSYDILWGIANGYLSDLVGRSIKLKSFDVANVKVSRGDYDAGAAGRLMEQAGAPAVIADAWQHHGEDRKTLVFTPTVAMAEHVTAEFVGRGIAAAYVHGGTPEEERRDILRAFKAGSIKVLSNCAVLTEGFDEPSVGCVVIARPTKSRALYVQMVGRGTRRHPDKTNCLVLDIVGASDDHSLMTVPSLFGVTGKLRARASAGATPISAIMHEAATQQAKLGLLSPEDVELFKEVRGAGIAWVPVHADGAQLRRFHRPMGASRDGHELPTVVLAQRSAEAWTAGLQWADGSKRVLIADVGMEMAQGVAEDAVRKMGGGALVNADAAWRKRAPSAKQRDAARKWHLRVDPEWTAGDLSDALDRHIAKINQRKPRTTTRR